MNTANLADLAYNPDAMHHSSNSSIGAKYDNLKGGKKSRKYKKRRTRKGGGKGKEKRKRTEDEEDDIVFGEELSHDKVLKRARDDAWKEGRGIDLTGPDEVAGPAAAPAFAPAAAPAAPAAPAFAPAFAAAPAFAPAAAPAFAPAFAVKVEPAPAPRNPALAQALTVRGIHHTGLMTDTEYKELEDMLPELGEFNRGHRVDQLSDAQESGLHPRSVRTGLGDEIARTNRQSECTNALLCTLALTYILLGANRAIQPFAAQNMDRSSSTAQKKAASGWGFRESKGRLVNEAQEQWNIVAAGDCQLDNEAASALPAGIGHDTVATATRSLPLAGDILCVHRLAQASHRLAEVARKPVPKAGLPGLSLRAWQTIADRAATIITSNMTLLERVLPRRRTLLQSCARKVHAGIDWATGREGGRRGTRRRGTRRKGTRRRGTRRKGTRRRGTRRRGTRRRTKKRPSIVLAAMKEIIQDYNKY